MPLLSGLRVIRSSIDGYGVIATRPFAAGEVIAEVDGVAWRDEDNLDDRYSLWIADGLYFDMVDQTRWINHSCDPNAEVDTGTGQEDGEEEGAAKGAGGAGATEGQVWARIVAKRAIAVGEEIAYDYAFPAHLAEPCRCGSPRCRGLIIDEDALPVPAAVAGTHKTTA